LKFLIVSNFDRHFLDGRYTCAPGLAGLPYERQLGELMASGFGVADAYSDALRQAGCEAVDVISNASPLQRRWAAEHGFAIPDVRTWHHDVLEAQVRTVHPDVVFVFEYNPVGDACLYRLKRHARLLIGQIASHLPARRTFEAYDLIVSSWPPIVAYFQRHGGRGRYLPLAFDDRALARLAPGPKRYDVTFVGGLAECHQERIALLEHVCARCSVDVWGYGIERLAPNSPIRRYYHGPCWGIEMLQVLHDSRLTLNVHGRIDVPEEAARRINGLPRQCEPPRLDGQSEQGSPSAPRSRGASVPSYLRPANNMRLYEATGVGTCLLTDERRGLSDLFRPGVEVATYADPADCVNAIAALLADDERRSAIARAGQLRTLGQHTFTRRVADLLRLVQESLAESQVRQATWVATGKAHPTDQSGRHPFRTTDRTDDATGSRDDLVCPTTE